MAQSKPRADVAAGEEDVVRIDRSQFLDRTRYTCPRGHMDWDRTNNHLWCATCRTINEQGRGDVDPEHWEIKDQKTGDLIDWERVELVD